MGREGGSDKKNDRFTILCRGFGFDKQRAIILSLFGIGKKRGFGEPGKHVAKK